MQDLITLVSWLVAWQVSEWVGIQIWGRSCILYFVCLICITTVPLTVICPVYPPVLGGVSLESCFTCPAGHFCSTEGLASPSGPCAAGFYCPFDFSSTTPYAFLCPKVRFCFSLYSLFQWIAFPVLPFSIVFIVFLTVSLLEALVPSWLLFMSWCIECHPSVAPLSLKFPCRATTVQKALPWPCLVPQESTSRTQAQIAASHVDLDSTARRP